MTVHAYLANGDHITVGPTGTGWAFDSCVHDRTTAPYISLSEAVIRLGVPPEIARVTKEFSLYDCLRDTGHRDSGKYTHRSATAEAEYRPEKMGFCLTIQARGKNLDDLQAIRDLIAAGKIAPSLPFGGQQVQSTVLGIKAAFHQLIESISLAYSQWSCRTFPS
ncbi:MAG: hypothetical protein WCT25_00115 [Candidatus Paceibacterota bacterium]|jgi:hypothetical protein